MTLKKQFTTSQMNYSTHLMNKSHSDQAEDFRRAFQIPSSPDRITMQKHLIDEEYAEFDWAIARRDPPSEQLKELADLVYTCYQFAANMDWDLDEAIRRVHISNMSKLDEYGNPIFRSDGKVLKSDFYQPPNLIDLV